MNKLLVSIIIPIYNVSKYVERALLSVLNQTYKNIEIILVDDCGTDDSMSIVRNTITKYDTDKKCKIVSHEYNRGLSAARNSGTQNSSGDYIYYLDSDDELMLDCIEKLVNLANKYKNVDVVVGNMSFYSELGDIICEKRFFTDSNELIEYNNDIKWIIRYMFDYSKNFYIPAVSQNKLYNKKFINKNKLYFVEGLIHEDEKFLFDLSNCIKTIAIEYDSTYIRYINPNSIMTSLNMDRSASFWVKIIESSYLNLQEPHLDLKCRYCIAELKRLLFAVTISNNDIVRNIKRIIIKLSKFSLSHSLYIDYLYCILLIILPIKLRNIGIINKIYKRLYKLEKILKIY